MDQQPAVRRESKKQVVASEHKSSQPQDQKSLSKFVKTLRKDSMDYFISMKQFGGRVRRVQMFERIYANPAMHEKFIKTFCDFYKIYRNFEKNQSKVRVFYVKIL